MWWEADVTTCNNKTCHHGVGCKLGWREGGTVPALVHPTTESLLENKEKLGW